ncbi:AraC family transcriptional regulator, partial [bacterium]|nr:AraC family transcriptional regulator [bacterium]
NIQFNLGFLYLKQEKYSEAQPIFEKISGLYEEDGPRSWEYIYSNYYLAVIQEEFGDYDKAQEYLDLFLVDFREISKNYEKEVREFNYTLGRQGLEQEIEALQDRITSHKRLMYVYIGLGVLLIVVLLIVLRKNIVDKRRARLKLKDFKEKFNQEEEERKKHVYSDTIQNFTMNDQKEKEILVALEKLIDKDYYLTSEFSLQNAAKKIKTNTTYLSHVVNKNYGKAFSEYSNELKVNYVIRQLMENKTYRKYSTQAMAESVGYKSAVSFTRSFKKRTGVTPVQFLKSVES